MRALGWVTGFLIAAALSVALVPGLPGAAEPTAAPGAPLASCTAQAPEPDPLEHARQCLVGVSSPHARPADRSSAPLLAPVGTTTLVRPAPVATPAGHVDPLASKVDGTFEARRRGPPPATRL